MVHLAVADEIYRRIDSPLELVRDPACCGNQQIPLLKKQKGQTPSGIGIAGTAFISQDRPTH